MHTTRCFIVQKLFLNRGGTQRVMNSVRLKIAGVYSVLFLQLCVTVLVTCGLWEHPSLWNVVLNNRLCIHTLGALACVSILSLYIFNLSNITRLCWFTLLTLIVSTLIGTYTCQLWLLGHNEVIWYALITTIALWIVLVLYTLFCFDSRCMLHSVTHQLLLVLLVLLITWCVFNPQPSCMYYSLGIVIFASYIVVDTARITHDTHNDIDILCASAELYLDVINMFVFVVDYMLYDDET